MRSIEMILQIMILLLGFVLLVKGADWFVEGAASIARKLGIPQLIVGLTIVAMGTSMPEAAVSITAALNGNAGITIGGGRDFLDSIYFVSGVSIYYGEKRDRAGRRGSKKYSCMEMHPFYGDRRIYGCEGQ